MPTTLCVLVANTRALQIQMAQEGMSFYLKDSIFVDLLFFTGTGE